MTKQQFLDELSVAVNREIVSYYDELISDRVEAGEPEEAVVASYDVKRIVKTMEFDVAKKELEEVSANKKKSKAHIAIIALCAFPVTVPLAIALCAILFALVVTAASLVFAGVAGAAWVVVTTIASIAAGDSINLILLNIGASTMALGIVGILGYYASNGLKKAYNKLTVIFFKKAKKNKEVK